MRGRQKGQTKRMSIIVDDSIYPYEVHIEEEQYILIQTEKQKTLGYFTTLKSLVSKLARIIMANEGEKYTLAEFADNMKNIHNKLTTNFKNI